MPGTKLFSWGFPAKSYLTTSTSWINVCSRSWGYIGKRKGKGEIKTDRERENGEGGQVGDNKMSVFCFLRKAIQTSRVAHFAKHLTFQFMRKRLLSRAVHQRGGQRKNRACRRDKRGCELQLLQRCSPHSEQLVIGWRSSERLLFLNPAWLLIRIQSHCTRQ